MSSNSLIGFTKDFETMNVMIKLIMVQIVPTISKNLFETSTLSLIDSRGVLMEINLH